MVVWQLNDKFLEKPQDACSYPGIVTEIVRVADYGYLAPKLLEFSTPCGHDGYGDNDYFELCPRFRAWGVCLGASGPEVDPKAVNCRYLSGKDDCQWESELEASQIPDKVEIWGREYY